MTLIVAATQPEAVDVPRKVVDLLVEVGSNLDEALSVAACFDKADMVSWLLDLGADPGAASISPLRSAAYHGSRDAADVLVQRTGIVPDAFYLAAAGGDLDRLHRWFDSSGHPRPEALQHRPNFTDVGWPGRAPLKKNVADVLAEALALAAHLGRTAPCQLPIDRGADPARAPLYGLTPLHFAASMRRLDTAELLVRHGAPLDVSDHLHDGTPLDWALHNGQRDSTLVRLLGGTPQD